MPVSAAKPCRHTGCSALVSDGTGFCGAHQADRKANRFGDERRGSSASRGYGSSWRKLRDQVMRRDNGLCQPCLKAGRVTQASAVDHVVPKSEGGTDAEGNLQAICEACHKAKTSAEAAKGRGASNL
jgi:5-methylcytosine-specific restriction enzyme A